MLVVDGTNKIFGRLASQVAKRLLQGEEIQLVNAEKLILRGNPKQISERYLTKRGLRNKGTPEHSPTWPRLPHLLVKRMMRGMLPRKTVRGKAALARLKVYTGNPKSLKESVQFEGTDFDGETRHMTIKELSRRIGYTG